jgi:hypothetical protein
MELPVLGESLDGGDLFTLAGDSQRQARADKPSAHDHAARAAYADAAAFFGSGKTDVIA